MPAMQFVPTEHGPGLSIPKVLRQDGRLNPRRNHFIHNGENARSTVDFVQARRGLDCYPRPATRRALCEDGSYN